MNRRGKGEGSVFFDSERKCWVGVLDLGADPDTGKRRRRKVSAPTKTAARDKLWKLAAELASTGTVAPRDITVETVVRAWLANLPPEIKSTTSVQIVTTHGERIIRAMGAVKLTDLKASRVDTFLRKMAADGYSTSVIQQTRRVLVRSIRQAQRDDLVGKNVAELVRCPAGKTRKSRSMTTAQALQLLGSDLDTWWRAYFTLALHCGLRPGELTGLRWQDVDFTTGVIRVRHSLKKEPDGLAPGGLKRDWTKRTLEMHEPVRVTLIALRKEQAADKLRLGQHNRTSTTWCSGTAQGGRCPASG